MEQISIAGIPWYSLEHFDEIKALMEDGHRLAATYSQWRLAAEQTERKLRREGKTVVRAHLEPNAFREHCRRHGLNVDSKGRVHFANWTARQHHAKVE